MQDWTTIGKVCDFPEGEWQPITVQDTAIIVFHFKGQFYALADCCTHDGGTLSDGFVEGEDIVCPRHGARFCIKTGKVTRPPAYEDVQSYPVRVEGDQVQIQMLGA